MISLGIDQGTTATKAVLLREDGSTVALPSTAHRQSYPQPGWVEHDPDELLGSIEVALLAAGDEGDAVGIANQGETVVAWDASTGRPLYPAIVWQDNRTSAMTDRLRQDGAEHLSLERSGLPLDPYFSASKLRWLLDNAPEAAPLRKEGRLRLATSDAFFLDRLAGIYATDVTTASRTGLLNLDTRTWDDDLCALFGVPRELLPPIRPTAGHFGETRSGKRRISASAVDQQAALFGHGCRVAGDAKMTFGTGAFALAVAGEARPRTSGILPTIAWQLRSDAALYALEGGVYSAGAAVDWIRRLGLFTDYAEIDSFERPSAIERGLVFVPALTGLASPYWDRAASGLWIGLSPSLDRHDLCQAVLEGIAMRAAQVVSVMAEAGIRGQAIAIDGGLSRNQYFVSFLARACNRMINVSSTEDATSLGIARLALCGAADRPGLDKLPPLPAPAQVVEPSQQMTAAELARFRDAVERARRWRASAES
jgi:glycerol kinase